MAKDGRPDQGRQAIPFLGEGYGCMDIIARIRNAGCREIDNPLSKNAAYACPVNSFRNRIFKKIPATDSRRPGEQHFHARKRRAQAHILRVDPGSLGRENILIQPDIQWQIVGQAAKECHGHMGVGYSPARA